MIDDTWRSEYRLRRYMENLSDEELRQRGQAIFRNFMSINPAGKASPLAKGHRLHCYWRMRFDHFLEECQLRYGPYPKGLGREFIDGLKFPKPTSKRVLSARAAMSSNRFEDGRYLVKYGRHNHLVDMLDNGTVKISPASLFNDSALNDAIRDTELEFSFHLHKPTVAELQPYINGRDVHSDWLTGTAIITETAQEDFYIYCLSATYDVRHFDDFDVDACIVITDPFAFRDRLLWTVHDQLNARGHSFSAVTYVDPLTESGKGVHFAFRKNAYFAYQDELRAVWLAKSNSPPLTAQFVSLGNLNGIAHLLDLR